MNEQNRFELAKYRIALAQECLDDATRSIEFNSFKNSANRSYYCIFHAMRAVLALDKLDFQKHSGVISAFRQRYIKTGIFPTEFSTMVGDAFNVRGSSDYEDFFVVSTEEVVLQAENAQTFLSAVEKYIGVREKTEQRKPGCGQP